MATTVRSPASPARSRLWPAVDRSAVRRVAATLWIVAVIVAAVYTVAGAARYSLQLADIFRGRFGMQTRTSSTPLRLRRDVPQLQVVDDRGLPAQLNLAGQTAIVLLSDDHCAACKDNFPRWLDLIDEVRSSHPNVPIYAMSLDAVPLQHAYWAGLDSLVRLRQIHSGNDMLDNFGTTSIPSTIVVRDGHVASLHVGAVGPWRRHFIEQELRP